MAATSQSIKIRFTGDADGVKKAARQAEDAVQSFGKKALGGIAKLAAGIPDMLSGIVSSLPPQGQLLAGVLGAGLAAALLPIVGAAISSAVLLGLGGGVLALGIKSAMNNPEVTAAFDGLKQKASKVFADFGKPFVDPLLRAFKTFGTALDALKPSFDRIAKMIAPIVDKLAPALAQFAKNAMPGIEAAVKASVPLFETLAAKLPLIGKAVSVFFEKIASSGPEANVFFGDMLDLIAGLIVLLGSAIARMAKWYVSLRESLSKGKQLFLEFSVAAIGYLGKLLDGAARALSWVPGLGPKLDRARSEFAEFARGANAELNKVRDRNVRINVWSNVGAVVANVANQLSRLGNMQVPSKAPGRANGGRVQAGRTYKVGERGPEYLTMGASGNITPNHALGGGSGNNYYAIVDVGNGVKQAIKLEFKQLKQGAMQMGAW